MRRRLHAVTSALTQIIAADGFCEPLAAKYRECTFKVIGLLSSLAQQLCHPLQQLPADHTILLHDRAKVPISKPVTKKVARGGDRRHACAFVNQSDLAEIIAWLQGGTLLAANKNRCLTGFDDEKGGATRALFDHSFTFGEMALFEEARDFLELALVQI